ncbi:MAG: MlaD family protein [Pseudomonadota bacterium]
MERPALPTHLIKHLGLKVSLLVGTTVFLALGFLGYTLFARGLFEPTRTLTLIAEDVSNVSIGMPLNFSGFPIGQVKRITLTEQGQGRIEIEVPTRHERWLRSTSVFTLQKPLVGGAKIRVFSTDLAAPPLAEHALPPLYTGDMTEELPLLITRAKNLLDNLERMTHEGSHLDQSLAHVNTVTGRMAGRYGVLEGVLGSADQAKKVVDAVDQANRLLDTLNGVSLKMDRRVFGQNGVMDQTDQALSQVNALLQQTRDSLKKADAILANAQEASGDLALLRGEIDDSVRKLNHLINEINRKWPFAREVEVKLP